MHAGKSEIAIPGRNPVLKIRKIQISTESGFTCPTPVQIDGQSDFVWKNGKTLDIWTSQTRVMTLWGFKVSKILTIPSFCLIFSKIQLSLWHSNVKWSVLPFFHTKSNFPSIWIGLGHVNPDPVDIPIFRIFKNGFFPGMAFSDLFLYSPTSPIVWSFHAKCHAMMRIGCVSRRKIFALIIFFLIWEFDTW